MNFRATSRWLVCMIGILFMVVGCVSEYIAGPIHVLHHQEVIQRNDILAAPHRSLSLPTMQMPTARNVPTEISRKEPHGSVEEQILSLQHMAHPLASRHGSIQLVTKHWLPFIATWYTPSGGEGSGLVTATGTHVQEGWTLAVDPHVIPLGSLVEIRFADGHTHVYKAVDTGGAIRGNHVDIFCFSEAQSIQNGVQKVDIVIYPPGTVLS